MFILALPTGALLLAVHIVVASNPKIENMVSRTFDSGDQSIEVVGVMWLPPKLTFGDTVKIIFEPKGSRLEGNNKPINFHWTYDTIIDGPEDLWRTTQMTPASDGHWSIEIGTSKNTKDIRFAFSDGVTSLVQRGQFWNTVRLTNSKNVAGTEGLEE